MAEKCNLHFNMKQFRYSSKTMVGKNVDNVLTVAICYIQTFAPINLQFVLCPFSPHIKCRIETVAVELPEIAM